jgi:hypothetical protein
MTGRPLEERGEPIVLGNEFAEVRVCRVETRNGARLLVESPKSGRWITLCPLEVEALTWQNAETFSRMLGSPFGPLFPDGEEDEEDADGGEDEGAGPSEDADDGYGEGSRP